MAMLYATSLIFVAWCTMVSAMYAMFAAMIVALHYTLYNLKLTIAVDSFLFRIIKGAF